MKYAVYLPVVLACLLWSCQSGPSERNTTEQPSQPTELSDQQLIEQVESIAKKMKAQTEGPIDKGLAREMIDLSVEYGQRNPEDQTQTPAMLFRAAEVARSIRSHQEAIDLFTTIYEKYPQHEKAPSALFLQGFTYEDGLEDKEKAKLVYQQLIDQYPDHPLAEQAQMLLEVIDKSPEELVKEFQKLNQQ